MTIGSPEAGRGKAPLRVLIIEEDAALRSVLCAAHEGEGYRALASDHLVEPLDVQQLRASLVVIDPTQAGVREGYGWLEAVRAWPGTTRLPVVFCSDHLTIGTAATRRVQALADATLPKPIEVNAILTAVARCLSGARPGEDRPHWSPEPAHASG